MHTHINTLKDTQKERERLELLLIYGNKSGLLKALEIAMDIVLLPPDSCLPFTCLSAQFLKKIDKRHIMFCDVDHVPKRVYKELRIWHTG